MEGAPEVQLEESIHQIDAFFFSSQMNGQPISNDINIYQNALEAGKEVWGIDKKMAVFNRKLKFFLLVMPQKIRTSAK